MLTQLSAFIAHPNPTVITCYHTCEVIYNYIGQFSYCRDKVVDVHNFSEERFVGSWFQGFSVRDWLAPAQRKHDESKAIVQGR